MKKSKKPPPVPPGHGNVAVEVKTGLMTKYRKMGYTKRVPQDGCHKGEKVNLGE